MTAVIAALLVASAPSAVGASRMTTRLSIAMSGAISTVPSPLTIMRGSQPGPPPLRAGQTGGQQTINTPGGGEYPVFMRRRSCGFCFELQLNACRSAFRSDLQPGHSGAEIQRCQNTHCAGNNKATPQASGDIRQLRHWVGTLPDPTNDGPLYQCGKHDAGDHPSAQGGATPVIRRHRIP